MAKRNNNDDDKSLSDNEFFNERDDFRERITLDQLIVMDDVFGLADKSKSFANSITVARKFNYTCLYIFHVIFPENLVWRTILSQTNILNIFPASISLAHLSKILESVSVRKTR